MRVVFENWVDRELAHVRGHVEKEREIPNPVEKLNLAYPPSPRRQPLERFQSGAEEGNDANYAVPWDASFFMVLFLNPKA